MNTKIAMQSIALLLLGAVAGSAGQRLLGGSSDGRAELLEELGALQNEQMAELTAVADERAQTTQGMALEQFYRLQEFRQFGSEGQALVWLVPTDGSGSSDPIAAAARGAAVRLPRLVVDGSARTTWLQAALRMTDMGSSVDPRIFAAFQSIQAFALRHPWPPGEGLAAARQSDWTRPDVVEDWLALNRALVSRVDGLLSGF